MSHGRHRMGYDPGVAEGQLEASGGHDSPEPASIESADSEGADVPEAG